MIDFWIWKRRSEACEARETEKRMNDHLWRAVERINFEKNTLMRELTELFGWDDKTWLHAVLHVRNAVLNLRADLAVLREENQNLRNLLMLKEEQLKQGREAIESLHKSLLEHFQENGS